MSVNVQEAQGTDSGAYRPVGLRVVGLPNAVGYQVRVGGEAFELEEYGGGCFYAKINPRYYVYPRWDEEAKKYNLIVWREAEGLVEGLPFDGQLVQELEKKGSDPEVARKLMSREVYVFRVDFIAQNNQPLPKRWLYGCLMVSKRVTNENMNTPETATFDGPQGESPDLDTFRVELANLPAGLKLETLFELFRGAQAVDQYGYFHVDMVHGTCQGFSTYRSKLHMRLVSNAPPDTKPDGSEYDDEFLEKQTILVKLGDVVRATVLLNGEALTETELSVGLPPSADPDAFQRRGHTYRILTADVRFLTLEGVSSAPATILARITEDWAQAGIRFSLGDNVDGIEPKRNILMLHARNDYPSASNDSIRVALRAPDTGKAGDVTVRIVEGDKAIDVARKLADAISKVDGFRASHHKSGRGHGLVLVNKDRNVAFDILKTPDGADLTFVVPDLDFGIDELRGTEQEAIALNFRDDDPKTIEMIAVPHRLIRNPFTGSAANGVGYGMTRGSEVEALTNVSFLRAPCVDDYDGTFPMVAGHEMGHILGDTAGDLGLQHADEATNLMHGEPGPHEMPETYLSPKRLNPQQQAKVRELSGPPNRRGPLYTTRKPRS